MKYVWDEKKSRQNLAKHKISFETAMLVFEDPHGINRLDRVTDGEERWQMLGLGGGIVLLLVAFTYRKEDDGEVIRIISARKATPLERRIYEKNL